MARLWTSLTVLLLAATALLIAPSAAHADVDDFEYAAWQVHYEVSIDDTGRAVAQVTEQLDAVFPEFDQNRGIVRALPLSYEKADAAPQDITVSDGNGQPVPFSVEDDDSFRIILVGDDQFVRGPQRYVISYTLHDVILATDDRDEFYWDIVPIERAQPIAAFSARVDLSPELAQQFTGATVCFTGDAYATDRCEITEVSQATVGRSFEVSPFTLAPGAGVTIGIALESGSVVQPPVRLPNTLLDIGPMIAAGLGLVSAIIGGVLIGRERSRRKQHRGVIVAQYEVPAEVPPLLAAPLIGVKKQTAAAQIVHLAVQGAIRIEDGQEATGLFGTGSPQPVLRLLDASLAGPVLGRRTLTALGLTGEAGSAVTIPKKDATFGKRVQDLVAAGTAEAVTLGYLSHERSRASVIAGAVAIALGVIGVALTFAGLARENALTFLISVPLGITAVVFGARSTLKHHLHTPRGAEAREHLEGVREFIRVAEADRLRLLQGATTAERQSDGSVDTVVLYEKLLPYAILFGLEKEWARTLETVYHERGVSNPLWYPALGITGLSHLDRSISSISQSFTTSVSYTSSSSGGTGGGGFSGGGGGGGFSGGR